MQLKKKLNETVQNNLRKMTTQDLLNDIGHHRNIAVDIRLIEKEIHEFQTAEEVRSLESVALILAGHSPIKEWRFDVDKLEWWCGENYIEFFKDEYNRQYRFRALRILETREYGKRIFSIT